MKPCSVCAEVKSHSEFYVRRASPDGLSYICKSCDGARVEERYRRQLRQYEMTGNVCAICGSDTPGYPATRWHIDHDHRCCDRHGYACKRCIRALLCGACNRGLGLFNDSPHLLLIAAEYLKSHALEEERAVQ